MAESAAPSQGRVFISYRREETAYPAGWLFDRLADHFGGGQIFKDVDTIQLGDDFVQVIARAVGSCDVLLALIGDRWLTITDAHGRRRLDDPDDFVRVEIEAALTRNVRVIPILIDGAKMPRADELPDSLAKLVRRHALELSPSRFAYDTRRLLKVLDTTLAEVRTAQDDAAAILASAGKAPDRGTTEVAKSPARRKQTSGVRTPTTRQVTPAMPSGNAEEYLQGAARRLQDDGDQVSRVQLLAGTALVGYQSKVLVSWAAIKLHLFTVLRPTRVATDAELAALSRDAVAYAKAATKGAPGFQTGVAVIPALIADTVTDQAKAAATARPKKEFAAILLPAIVDLSSGQTFTYQGRILWGAVFTSWLRARLSATLPASR